MATTAVVHIPSTTTYHPDGSLTYASRFGTWTWRCYATLVDGRRTLLLAEDQREAEQIAMDMGGTRPRVTNSLTETGIYGTSWVLSGITARRG